MKRNHMLVLGSAMPPMIVETKSYEQDRAVRDRADLPFVPVGVTPAPYMPPPLHNRTRSPMTSKLAGPQHPAGQVPIVAEQSELAPE